MRAWNRNARSLSMIPASARRGAIVAGVSPSLTVNDDLVGSARRPAPSATRPRSSRTRSAMKPIRSAPGLSSTRGTMASRAIGRATVSSGDHDDRREHGEEDDEAEEAAHAAAAIAVAVVAALVAGPATVAPGALVAVGPLAAPVRDRHGHVLARDRARP